MGGRFIVSTGRCGSTALSRALAAHPGVLVLSEAIQSLEPGAFPAGALSGDEAWELVARPRPVWRVAYGSGAPEFRYPIDGGGRYTRVSPGLPGLLAITLPTLTGDPDALLDELEPIVRAGPRGPVGAHYARLYAALAGRFGRAAWVERSAPSLGYVGAIAREFPGARFVHLHRAGRDTALSMSRHPAFRFYAVRETVVRRLGFDPYATEARPGPVPSDLAPLMPETFDGAALAAHPQPLEDFGRRWSAMILRGMRSLGALPSGSVLHIAYERLVAEPAAQLERIAEFLALPEPRAQWVEEAAAGFAPRPPAWRSLPADALERLDRACEPGERRLRGVRDG